MLTWLGLTCRIFNLVIYILWFLTGLCRVLSYPENPPQINFNDYRNKVASKDLVQQLEQAYKSLKIPYPKDTLSHEVDQQEADYKKQCDAYVSVANAKIAEAEKLVCELKKVSKYWDTQVSLFLFSSAENLR